MLHVTQNNPFKAIYQKGGWAKLGSGPGSQVKFNTRYIQFLEKFIIHNKIKSIVDYGCGDWTFSQHIDWKNSQYLGIDCVEDIIAQNRRRFTKPNVQFNLQRMEQFNYPSCDLLVVKDVLQHWDNKTIQKFLQYIKNRQTFALITNDKNKENKNVSMGNCRGIELTAPPFNQQGTYVFYFDSVPNYPWDKITLLIKAD